MIARSLIAAACLLAGCAAAPAARASSPSPYTPPPQTDGLVSAPGNFTKLFENDEIRVLVFKLASGATDRAHTHPRYFARVISGGKIAVHFADGEHAEHEMTTGDTYWSDGSRLHTTENVGTTPVEIMLVEVK